MSVATFIDTHAGLGARIKSAIKTLFANMVAAREAEARRLVAAQLALYENDRLREQGLARKAANAPAKLAYRH